MIEQDAPSVLVRVYLFGECHVDYRQPDGNWNAVLPQEWGGTTHSRRLLGFLLLHGRRASRGKLMEQLWVGSEAAALEGSLNKAVSNVRKIMHAEWLLTMNSKRTIYQLADQSHIWADVDAYEAALQEAELCEPASSLRKQLLEMARTTFERGPLLEGEDDLWCHARRERLETSFYRCLLRLAETYEAQGQPRQAEEQIEKLLQKNPLDETALVRFMQLLRRQGLAAEALRRYQSAVNLFKKQGIPLSSNIEAIAHQLQQPEEAKNVTLLPASNLSTWKNQVIPSDQSDLVYQATEETSGPFLSSSRTERMTDNILVYPTSMLQQRDVLENVLPDCAAKCGVMLAQTTTLIQQWSGMAMFSHELQRQIDQRIKEIEALKTHYAPDAYTFSRRSFLITLAALPSTLLLSRQHVHKIALELEEFLPRCAASIVACWHLSGGDSLEAIPPIINAYLPPLLAIVKSMSSYREIAADLVAQCYFLKTILAWHLDSLDKAEAYCTQAMCYSDIANNANLRLTALNQHALIAYYAKDFHKALLKSEEARETLLHTSREHIFPIVRGRVYMYLAAFQAHQAKNGAEQTLELARNAFAQQAATMETVPLYADCGEAPLQLWDGLTHYHLRIRNPAHINGASAALSTFGQLQPDAKIPERFRLECLTNRTLAAIQANDLEEAIHCFNAGRQGARALESKQRNAEVAYNYQQMLNQWPDESCIRQLRSASSNQ